MMDLLCGAYDALNSSVFNSKLRRVRFIVAPNRKGILHFQAPSQIEIGADFLTASPIEVLDDLVHAMVHRLNQQLGVVDSNHNHYHTSEFRGAAARIGLFVARHGSRGWSLTCSSRPRSGDCDLPDKQANQRLLAAYRRLKFSKESLHSCQKSLAPVLQKRSNKKFLLRYVCRCKAPHNTIRSGRRPNSANPLDVTCNLCGAKFVLSD